MTMDPVMTMQRELLRHIEQAWAQSDESQSQIAQSMQSYKPSSLVWSAGIITMICWPGHAPSGTATKKSPPAPANATFMFSPAFTFGGTVAEICCELEATCLQHAAVRLWWRAASSPIRFAQSQMLKNSVSRCFCHAAQTNAM